MWIKKIIGFGLLFPLTLFTISCSNEQEKLETVYVAGVHDGDTFNDEKGNKYRIFGINTPEISDHNNNFKPTEGLEKIYAIEARDFLRERILGKNLTIKHESVDKYGRFVVMVFCDGKNISLSLVKNGMARVEYISVVDGDWFFTNEFTFYRELLRWQRYAWKNSKGIWANRSQINAIFSH